MKRGVRDVAALLPPNAEQQFNRKGIIYDSNESCKRLYQVRWGRVMLSSGLHDGRPLATRIVGVNGLFGEGVLAAFPDHSESAVALDATCVFSWSRNEIEEIVNREPGIGLSLTAYFVKRCVELNTRLEDIAFRKTPERVLSSLLHLAETLGTPDGITHTLRITNLQRIVYKVMADNNLDALVYVYTTIPAPLVYPSRVAAVYEPRVELRVLKAGTKMSNPDLVPGEPSLKTDLDTWRSAGGSFAVNLSPASGLPAIVVPAGFTRVIYDRVPDASDPNGSRLDGPKSDQIPVAMEFLGRPFDEALLFEIASAFEAGTKHRRPPKGFGPLAGEP